MEPPPPLTARFTSITTWRLSAVELPSPSFTPGVCAPLPKSNKARRPLARSLPQLLFDEARGAALSPSLFRLNAGKRVPTLIVCRLILLQQGRACTHKNKCDSILICYSTAVALFPCLCSTLSEFLVRFLQGLSSVRWLTESLQLKLCRAAVVVPLFLAHSGWTWAGDVQELHYCRLSQLRSWLTTESGFPGCLGSSGCRHNRTEIQAKKEGSKLIVSFVKR
ncbi:uncharacterized protein LOC121772199 isoform X2 [Salvia splendens]|uniref:uncharacterized protein LOC121772199 isoform X2 n=1 Tax=Salvia splendens TaxID=180675 RepID=UPI001C253C00|nr:uncharacterized protein LOC121772199 isoform X2 [Salvia splendens]